MSRARCALKCTCCGRVYHDRRLACDVCPDALLRADYRDERLSVGTSPGLFRFQCWLPGAGRIETDAGPVVFQSRGYGAHLGLRHLWIAYNGYWPERGARNITGTFKDLEAAPTIAHLQENRMRGIVVASAGNTARAFACASIQAGFRCVIVLPERMLHRMWSPVEPTECVQIVAIAGSNDYEAAITLSRRIAHECELPVEGGARNVARRDGMGTTMLEFARITGRLPVHYVQAVGSGTGGIAAYEAGVRLLGDGRFGETLPRLHLAQNTPVTPIHDAWTRRAAEMPARPASDRYASDVAGMYADVLANRNPPYALAGGVRDVLRRTCGETYAVTRPAALAAKARFERLEQAAINEPAACACAALECAVQRGLVRPDEQVLLNITGGGEAAIRRDFPVHRLVPSAIVPASADDAGFSRALESAIRSLT